jgi:hypothetical protein
MGDNLSGTFLFSKLWKFRPASDLLCYAHNIIKHNPPETEKPRPEASERGRLDLDPKKVITFWRQLREHAI